MKEIRGNLWDHLDIADAIVITTNGFIKANGECVMGRGCAREATERFPNLSKDLGATLTVLGNHVFLQNYDGHRIITFPVKPKSMICNQTKTNIVNHMKNKFKAGSVVPGWACTADLDLIINSAKELRSMVTTLGLKNVVMPRPGCGAGELEWDTVKKSIEPILNDRFSIITY